MACFIQRADASYLYFDITDEEQHQGKAVVTDYPVEDGPNVTDHMRVALTPFTMKCTISNTPIKKNIAAGSSGDDGRGGTIATVVIANSPYQRPVGLLNVVANPIGTAMDAVGGALAGKPQPFKQQVVMFPSEFDAVRDMLDALNEMQEGRELVDVTTSKRVYNQVVLESFEMTRNASTGTGAEVTLTFKTLRIVDSASAATPTPTEPRGTPPKAKGKQAPTPASAADKTSLIGQGTGYHD